jgi:hypothetical protein
VSSGAGELDAAGYVAALMALVPERFRKPSALRFMVGHMAAYPVAVIYAIGMIPLALASLRGSDVLEHRIRVTLEVVLRAGLPSLAAFGIVHALAIPWMRTEGEGERQRRFFLGVTLALVVLGLLGGAAAWGMLITGQLT